MKHPDPKLITPIHVKTAAEDPWPTEPVFYILAGNGLFRCRNNEFFTSCVVARNCPSELAPQRSFLKVRYPKVPRRLFELVVGFHWAVYQRHGSESAMLLVWDRLEKRVRLVVPEQEASVSRSWSGHVWPIDVHYELPANLPPHQFIFGDVHCHGDGGAYSSYTDQNDEIFRAGLHIVVGRIRSEPPDIHIEAVVDGARFTIEPEWVLGGYSRRRSRVPEQWIEQVRIRASGYSSSGGYGSTSGSGSSTAPITGGSYGSSGPGAGQSDHAGDSKHLIWQDRERHHDGKN